MHSQQLLCAVTQSQGICVSVPIGVKTSVGIDLHARVLCTYVTYMCMFTIYTLPSFLLVQRSTVFKNYQNRKIHNVFSAAMLKEVFLFLSDTFQRGRNLEGGNDNRNILRHLSGYKDTQNQSSYTACLLSTLQMTELRPGSSPHFHA